MIKILSKQKEYSFKTIARNRAHFNFNLENFEKLEKIIKKINLIILSIARPILI